MCYLYLKIEYFLKEKHIRQRKHGMNLINNTPTKVAQFSIISDFILFLSLVFFHSSFFLVANSFYLVAFKKNILSFISSSE